MNRGRALLAAAVVTAALGLSVTHGAAVVTGSSMEPALTRGDLVVYRRTSRVPVSGMAVYARESGGLVVHRVVGVDERGELRTKGDANASADFSPVPRARVRGRVVGRVPFGRIVSGAGV